MQHGFDRHKPLRRVQIQPGGAAMLPIKSFKCVSQGSHEKSALCCGAPVNKSQSGVLSEQRFQISN